MSLSCVALEKIPKIRTEFVDELVRFFETDTTWFEFKKKLPPKKIFKDDR